MKFIVVTEPEFIPHEAGMIMQLFDAGLDTLHLRKPHSQPDECAALLAKLPVWMRRHTVVHDHFGLCGEYGLQGVHLNRRNPDPPTDFHGHTVSASCHSIGEAEERKAGLDYVFLSPVFNSISKQGYQSAYTDDQLVEAANSGIIDSSVIALGGVTLDRIAQLRQWYFGGAAFLGDVWNKAGNDAQFAAYARQLRQELDRK